MTENLRPPRPFPADAVAVKKLLSPSQMQERISDLEAEVISLTRRAEEAEAMVAVLTEAATPRRVYTGDAPTVYEQRCKLCNSVAYGGTVLAHMPDCPLKDADGRAQALLAEHERLKGNQRTPGTVEVCSRCKWERRDPRGLDWEHCCHTDCPVRVPNV